MHCSFSFIFNSPTCFLIIIGRRLSYIINTIFILDYVVYFFIIYYIIIYNNIFQSSTLFNHPSASIFDITSVVVVLQWPPWKVLRKHCNSWLWYIIYTFYVITIYNNVSTYFKFIWLFVCLTCFVAYAFEYYIGTWCEANTDGLFYAWYDWLWPSNRDEGVLIFLKKILISYFHYTPLDVLFHYL